MNGLRWLHYSSYCGVLLYDNVSTQALGTSHAYAPNFSAPARIIKEKWQIKPLVFPSSDFVMDLGE